MQHTIFSINKIDLYLYVKENYEQNWRTQSPACSVSHDRWPTE